MAYTKRQYALMTVLAVLAAALVVDLMFLRDSELPRSAHAQGPLQPHDFTAAGGEVKGAPRAEASRYAVARALRQYAAEHAEAASAGAEDAFQPSSDWMTQLRHKPVELDKTQALAQGFLERHRLSSVVSAAGQATAIVDERVMRVGDVLEGFQLASIGADSVVFANQEVNVVLKVHSRSAE
jgi:hypothetical protein